MTTLEQMKAALAELECKPFSGVQSVRFGNEQVTYRSADELIKQIEYLRQRIAQLENPSGRIRYSVARFNCR